MAFLAHQALDNIRMKTHLYQKIATDQPVKTNKEIKKNRLASRGSSHASGG